MSLSGCGGVALGGPGADGFGLSASGGAAFGAVAVGELEGDEDRLSGDAAGAAGFDAFAEGPLAKPFMPSMALRSRKWTRCHSAVAYWRGCQGLAPASGGRVMVRWSQHLNVSTGPRSGAMRGRWMPRPRGVGLEGALSAARFGGAHQAPAALGVGAFLGHEQAAGAFTDPVDPGLLVDPPGGEVLGGVLEGLRYPEAVPVALDEDRAVRSGLLAESVCAVAIDGLTQ
jgi:hypothetical protein